MLKYRGGIAGFIWGTLYTLVVALLFSVGEHYSVNFLEFVSMAMLVFAPVSVGIITVLCLTKEQALNVKIRLFHPWLPVVGWSLLSIILAFETIICIIMLLPLYLPLSSLGGIVGGYIRKKYADKTKIKISGCFALLPFFVAPLEHPITSPTLFHSVTDTVIINAPMTKVWRNISNIENISPAELSWNVSHFIGIPKPVSAKTAEFKIGGLRELSWEKGVHFQEKITDIQVNKKLAYEVIVDQESMKIAELDTHIVVGDKYFDVLSGSYDLKLVAGEVHLSLTTRYTMTSKVNWYGALWANFILDDFHHSVLGLIKNRVEAEINEV